jgi:hypothetical protein
MGPDAFSFWRRRGVRKTPGDVCGWLSKGNIICSLYYCSECYNSVEQLHRKRKEASNMIIISKEEIAAFKKLDIMYQMNLLKEQIEKLERKHGCSLDQFRSLVNDSDEEFGLWDDLIEWEACQASLNEMSSILENINAGNIEVR